MARRRGTGRYVHGRRCARCDSERSERRVCEGCLPTLLEEWSRYVASASSRATIRGYGITVDDHARLFFMQDGLCGICRDPERSLRDGPRVGLVVDHDHSTGVVRGLLCSRCNQAIGMMRDEPDWLTRAKVYVVRHGQAKDPESAQLRRLDDVREKLAGIGESV